METQISLSDFFAEKVDLYLESYSFYAKEDKSKVLDLMKETAGPDFVAICQKTKQDIFKFRETLNYQFPIEFQFTIFDKNIFTYVKTMVEKSKN